MGPGHRPAKAADHTQPCDRRKTALIIKFQHLAAAVPQSRLIEMADAGRYLFYSHWRAMLDAVV
jgi:hypothetical protein